MTGIKEESVTEGGKEKMTERMAQQLYFTNLTETVCLSLPVFNDLKSEILKGLKTCVMKALK